MTHMNKEQTAHEIRKLEQELDNLERSYAAFERGALWAKNAFFVFIAGLLNRCSSLPPLSSSRYWASYLFRNTTIAWSEPHFCDETGKHCRLPYGAPEP